MSDRFQWFRLIVENRPSYSENVTALDDINDIRNGVFANVLMHNWFNQRRVVILKVCHICPPACPLSDPMSPPILRLQTIFLKPKIFPHATIEELYQKMSVIRVEAVIHCNGW